MRRKSAGFNVGLLRARAGAGDSYARAAPPALGAYFFAGGWIAEEAGLAGAVSVAGFFDSADAFAFALTRFRMLAIC